MNPITSNSSPKLEKLPAEVEASLARYPELAEEVRRFYNEPPLPVGYEYHRVDIYLDDVLSLTWLAGEVINYWPLEDLDYQPEAIQFDVDEQPGYLMINGVELINRVQNLSVLPFAELWSK